MNQLRKGANEVAQKLRDAGYDSYFAGGSVRDLLLGLTPKDFDLVTDASPEEVDRLFRRTVLVGAQFGVVRVLWSKNREYEVASYRTDGAYSDGRRPNEVVYSKSKEEDVKRRDFTINALLMDPFNDEVFDYVSGKQDLDSGLIRAVGEPERRFQEDRLRLLRAVRFAARFGFAIEEHTMKALQENARFITEVSEERIVTELHGTWSSARPEHGMRLLRNTGLLTALFPGLVESKESELLRRFEGYISVRSQLEPDEFHALAWALVFDLCHLDDLDHRLRELKLSRNLIKQISVILSNKEPLLGVEQLSLAERVRIIRAPFFQSSIRFLQLIVEASHPCLKAWNHEQEKLKSSPLPKLPLITGGDLSKLGFKPGPIFKKILRAVEDEVFERRIVTAQEAIDWVKQQDWP